MIFALSFVASAATGCSTIEAPGSTSPQAMQERPSPYAKTGCFYSDISGKDRISGDRVFHWCGPKPKALF